MVPDVSTRDSDGTIWREELSIKKSLISPDIVAEGIYRCLKDLYEEGFLNIKPSDVTIEDADKEFKMVMDFVEPVFGKTKRRYTNVKDDIV
jgi:hypothetical protein